MEKKKVPEIRFEGFEGEWEKKKLGELYECNNERNVNKNIGFDKTISVATMNYKEDGNGAALDSLATYKILRLGDIAFEGHTNKEFLYGRFVLNDIGDGIMSPRFSALHPKKIFPISFWKYYIHHEPVMRKILVNSTKAGTMMNELDIDDFLEQVIYVPGDDEQKTIGEYFTNLDNLITNAEERHTKLLALKKSLLQKMFPQEGESVPKIRFEGFEGDWAYTRVEKLIEDYIEKTTIPNQYPVLTSSLTKGIALQKEYFSRGQVTTDNNVGYFVLPRGYFTYRSRSDTYSFSFNRNDIIDKGIISIYYPVFSVAKNTDSNFLKFRLNYGIENILIEVAEGTGQKVLSHEKFKQINLQVPGIDEQKAIGDYFTNLDTLIEAQEQKITKLRQMKSALLQKMFV